MTLGSTNAQTYVPNPLNGTILMSNNYSMSTASLTTGVTVRVMYSTNNLINKYTEVSVGNVKVGQKLFSQLLNKSEASGRTYSYLNPSESQKTRLLNEITFSGSGTGTLVFGISFFRGESVYVGDVETIEPGHNTWLLKSDTGKIVCPLTVTLTIKNGTVISKSLVVEPDVYISDARYAFIVPQTLEIKDGR